MLDFHSHRCIKFITMKPSLAATKKQFKTANDSFITTKKQIITMKKLIILSAIAMSGLVYNTANAQVRLHFGFRFNTPRIIYAAAPVVVAQAPVYEEPVQAYDQPAQVNDDSDNDYYYLPDVDAYYDVNEQCYYYLDGDNWISAAFLPGAYHNYDWRNATRYEVRAPRPYLHNDFYRSKYNGHVAGSYNNHNNGGYANQGYRNNDQHFDNRGEGGYSQPAQPNRNNEQRFDNRGQGGSTQPSNQNNGRQRDTRGGAEHFVQNSPQGGYSNHRMSKF